MGRSKSTPQQRQNDDRITTSSEVLGRITDPNLSNNDPLSLYLSMQQQQAEEEREEEEELRRQSIHESENEENPNESSFAFASSSPLSASASPSPSQSPRKRKLVRFKTSSSSETTSHSQREEVSVNQRKQPPPKKGKAKKTKKLKKHVPSDRLSPNDEDHSDDNDNASFSCVTTRPELEIKIIVEEDLQSSNKDETATHDNKDNNEDADERRRVEIYYHGASTANVKGNNNDADADGNKDDDDDNDIKKQQEWNTNKNSSILIRRMVLPKTVLLFSSSTSSTTTTTSTTTTGSSVSSPPTTSNNSCSSNIPTGNGQCYPITTRLGLQDVWRCCVSPYLSSSSSSSSSTIGMESGNATNNNPSLLQALADTLQDGTMIYELVQYRSDDNDDNDDNNNHNNGNHNSHNDGIVELHISCSRRALQECSPTMRPMRSSSSRQYKNKNKKQQFSSGHAVVTVLSALFPNDVLDYSNNVAVAAAASNHLQKSVSIPAKRVYALTDNVQLLQRDIRTKQSTAEAQQQQQQSSPLSSPPITCTIPGLVPTLRPYQQAAVQWMLERECLSSTVTGKEWELAWLVLTVRPVVASSTSSNVGTAVGGMEIDPPDGRTSDSDDLGGSGCSWEPLMDWNKKQQQQHDRQKDNRQRTITTTTTTTTTTTRLFLCPFTGWLADSYEMAQAMTVDPSSSSSSSSSLSLVHSRGGILAESMGLGKTVEVLACILAHPRPLSIQQQHKQEQVDAASTSVITSPARRRLNMDLESETKDKICSSHPVEMDRVENVGSMNDFGDAEDDNDYYMADQADEAEEIRPASTCTPKKALPILSGETSSVSAAPVAVTPDAPQRPPPKTVDPIPERWFEPSVTSFGSCICGQSIGWDQLLAASLLSSSTGRKRSHSAAQERCVFPIVFCASCDEPMHGECTSFCTMEELVRETSPMTYRRMISQSTAAVRVCTDKTRCPCCFASSPMAPYQSRATLIITPPAILSQWEREIQRHTLMVSDNKPLKVLVYQSVNGISKLSWIQKTTSPDPMNGRSRQGAPIQLLYPTQLGDADVVLMTFDSLMADLGHSNDNRFVQNGSGNGSESLRRRKKYRVVPSPLTQIHWWRVCLDEAQRVETPTAKSARMALKLETEHRWAVSGTPIGKGKLEDLYGLLSFLRLEPFSSKKQWFDRCFRTIGESDGRVDGRIQHLLRDVFWRSTKAFDMVREQMGVPEQTETKVILRFSSIEKHFYDRQLEQTLALAGDAMEREKSGKKRKSSQLDLLAERLHRLRAACCHPQVGSSGIGRVRGKKKQRGAAGQHPDGSSSNAVGSRIMSMDQILDRFIEDAKKKCEEAQRLTVLHTNAMAALSKLTVEARTRSDIPITESDESLLSKSCQHYVDSLELAEENATPTLVVGETVFSGSLGFQSPSRIIRDGAYSLDWKGAIRSNVLATTTETTAGFELWARIDFEGPARKITQIRARPVTLFPEDVVDEEIILRRPKDCIFQVSSAAVGGEFIDVASFSFPATSTSTTESVEDDWIVSTGFRTNKSKAWRLLVRSFHLDTGANNYKATSDETPIHVAIELELLEATIASDPLQRLHCLHNAAMSLASLIELKGEANADGEALAGDFSEMKMRVDAMTQECTKIDTLYLDGARSLHGECHRRLHEAITHRESNEKELLDLSIKAVNKNAKLTDVWEDTWYDDFLVACHLYADQERQVQICQRLIQELEGVVQTHVPGAHLSNDVIPFPAFGDLPGFRAALQLRLERVRSGLGEKPPNERSNATTGATQAGDAAVILYQTRKTHFKCPPGGHASCMQTIVKLASNPSDAEVFENSHCRVCKEDWNQTGPVCRHCKIEDKLRYLTPDRVTLTVLATLHSIVRSPAGSAVLDEADSTLHVTARAKKFFDVIEAERKELIAAWRLWRTHLDLLNDVDELNACKTAMRLAYEGEDVTQLTEDQLNAIVVPIDVNTRYHDHAAKQAMALGSLRRAKDTLRYLKNQSSEQRIERGKQECMVCLSGFDTDRAVLRCGHSFHYSPCLEKIQTRCGGHIIRCPLRCKVATKPQDVMIASQMSAKDGSHSKRQVKGSWGTKVTQLVADILDVCDSGEKSLVFSQWEDMLDIVEEALAANSVQHVRATSLRRIGECVRRLRSPDCSVLLLNVKNGAEGLTLLEATHVFMIEPLLNHGLDSQAINRIHRIGQSKKTFVHRYLMDQTIEMKIDTLRMDHQEDQLEDSMSSGKQCLISAGGIDGGFRSEEELMNLLRID